MSNINHNLSDDQKKELYNKKYLEIKARVRKFHKLNKIEKSNSMRLFPSGGVYTVSTVSYYKDNEDLE